MTTQTPTSLDDWVERYLAAWRENDPEIVASLFRNDARYRCEPYAETWTGRDTIVERWLANEDQLGPFEFTWRPVLLTKEVTLVEGLATYGASSYSILWVIKELSDGTCADFTEWWMELPGNASAPAVREELTVTPGPSVNTAALSPAEVLPWLTNWVSGYVTAWKGNDPETIASLFAEDGILQTEPYADRIHGRHRVIESWLANPEKLGDFVLDWHLLVAADDFTVVEGTVTFATESYNILWPLRFDHEKRCLHFLEWWMRRPEN